MQSVKTYMQKRRQKRAVKHDIDSKRAVLDEIFNDLYDSRSRVYKMNFVRGVLFGSGSVIGGTVVIALIVWLLSLFVNVPVIGDVFKNAQQSIEQTTD